MMRCRFSESGFNAEQIVDEQVPVWFYIDVQKRPVLLHPAGENQDGSYTLTISRDFLKFPPDFYILSKLEKIGSNDCIFHAFEHNEKIFWLEEPISLDEVIRQGYFEQKLGVIKHKIRGKPRNILDSVIEAAQARCKDPKDVSQVWVQLSALALEKTLPLLNASSEGLKYTKDGRAAYFTRDALYKRLKRK